MWRMLWRVLYWVLQGIYLMGVYEKRMERGRALRSLRHLSFDEPTLVGASSELLES
jgi:hypothetical protein